MDFKNRFQGRTTTMDKNGVIGIVSKISQPINKYSEPQIITKQYEINQNPPSYYFQKDRTPSTRSEQLSYKFRQDLQKLNLDEYEIIAIPKKTLESEKHQFTHTFVPIINKRMNNMACSQVGQGQQMIKTKNYSRYKKNVNQLQNANTFIQAGYGVLKQKQLYLKNLRK